MPDIYIISEFGKLGKKDDALIFYTPEGKSQILYPFKIAQLILIGKISISGDAIRLLSRHKIPVSFISANGIFNSRLTYAAEKNVLLRQKQYRMLEDTEQSLKVAKMIVCGKIKNQISFMQRIKRKFIQKNSKNTNILELVTAVKTILRNAKHADDIDSLRGFEGAAAKYYFQVLKYNIQAEWADFPCRSKNPPRTNVNAVLSFLYTILMNRIEAFIETAALDPMLGTLHSLHYSSNALVFDLTEEFRVPIADTICCDLFNLGILKPNDFEQKILTNESFDYSNDAAPPSDTSTNSILLTQQGLRKVIDAFEKKLNTSISAVEQKNISYREIIFSQIESYKKMLSGACKNYTPYYFK